MTTVMNEDQGKQIAKALGITKLAYLWETQEPGSKSEFQMIQGKDVFITLAPLAEGSLEGRFIAQIYSLHRGGSNKPKGWPRYYFDWHYAIEEVETWLVRNGQIPLPASTKTHNEQKEDSTADS